MTTSLSKVKKITKRRSSKKSTKRRSSKKITKRRSSKKSTKRRSVKKSTKRRSVKKSTKRRSVKKSTKRRSTKKSTKRRSVEKSKKSTKDVLLRLSLDRENVREYFKLFVRDLREVDAYLGHMVSKLDLYDYYNEDEIDKELESLLEKDNWVGKYSIPEYYDMIDTIKFLIKSDKNMKKEILNKINTYLIRDIILNNLKKKVPELFR